MSLKAIPRIWESFREVHYMAPSVIFSPVEPMLIFQNLITIR
jgi:hypothetical protein